MAALSIVLLSLVNLFSTGFAACVHAGRTSQAAVLAQEKMEVLRAHTLEELLQKGTVLNDGVYPCPGAVVSSTPEVISGFEGLLLNYSMTCDLLQFDGYPLQGLRLDVMVQQEEGKQTVRFASFIPKRP
jgi:hypothetical protein